MRKIFFCSVFYRQVLNVMLNLLSDKTLGLTRLRQNLQRSKGKSMHETTDPETPPKRGWSIVFKAQFIGGLIGALPTIGLLLYCTIVRPGLWGFSGLFMQFLMIPVILIIKLFGLTAHWFVDDRTGNFAFFPACILVLTNLIVGFLMGSLIGVLIQRRK